MFKVKILCLHIIIVVFVLFTCSQVCVCVCEWWLLLSGLAKLVCLCKSVLVSFAWVIHEVRGCL